MVIMNEKRHVYEALTRYNYFPNQKESIGEIPPCFSSRQFTPEIADLIASDRTGKRSMGYDVIEFRATRQNNYPRRLEIVHPKAYSMLVHHINKYWDEIKYIKKNESSMIKPEVHADGRIIIMNYEDSDDRTIRELGDSFGRFFKVKTDISGCFATIYSHAIPWAVLGLNEAKERASRKIAKNDRHWSEELDFYQRICRRNETQGIPIGSASSSIVVELILSTVDNTLRDKGYFFRRYIDDYTTFCETHVEAKDFIRELATELGKFKMSLNLHKTHIIELPDTLQDDWVSLLSSAKPSILTDSGKGWRKLHTSEVVQYLDFAVQLNKKYESGSVLKYAVSSVIFNIDDLSVNSVINYVINLSWHYPILIPYIEVLLDKDVVEPELFHEKLIKILYESCKHNRSDGVSWILYYISKYSLEINDDVADSVIRTGDCLTISILYHIGKHTKKIIEFVSSIINLGNVYELDKIWVLLYQMYRDGIVDNPYSDECFNILRDNNVNFIPGNEVTNPERYCDYLNNVFWDPEEDGPLLAYNDWLNK